MIEILTEIVLIIVGLLKAGLIYIVPILIIGLILSKIREIVSNRLDLNWTKSLLIVLFVFSYLFCLGSYFIGEPNVEQSLFEKAFDGEPEFGGALDGIINFFSQSFRLLVPAIIITLLGIVFALIGSALSSILENKTELGAIVRFAIASYFTLVIALAINLYFMPWIIVGIFQMIYFT